MEPKGTIIFGTVGRTQYGFDIFTTNLSDTVLSTHLITDCVSINYNAQFTDQPDNSVLFISERTGSPRTYLIQPGLEKPKPLPFIPASLFHDRPILKNNHLYFVSAHERPDPLLKSWCAIYTVDLNNNKEGANIAKRLTPAGVVDYSPAVSGSGKFIAVGSYGDRNWGGDFRELKTEIAVFDPWDPSKRVVVSDRGGWPTWCGDSVIYFHRQHDDGWWSVFRVDIPEHGELFSSFRNVPDRITPPGVHCFTPAAFQDGKRIAVATRRKTSNYRHVEIFDVESRVFSPITELISSDFHHYNPFVSSDSMVVGYHRFRGENAKGKSTIPNLDFVQSPIGDLHMFRLNGFFPSVSPDGEFIAFNNNLDGLRVVKSDGSRRWSLINDRTAFYTSWSPIEKNVIYTSVGPIFESPKMKVQIARVSFDASHLEGDDKMNVPCDIKILTEDDTGNNAFPSCSPDGKSIVFRSGRSGYKNLYVMDAINGEDVRQITDGPCIDTMPSWSPRGDLIAFSSNRHNPDNAEAFSIYVVKPDGSDLRRIYVAGPEGSIEADRERINHVCFSQDGEWLLFTANFGGVTADPISFPNQFQPYGDLFAMRLDGTGLTRLTWNAYENGTPAWYPGSELGLGHLGLSDAVGDKLVGRFDEPLWLSCDI